jgi:energy-coupling factor transporter ATP-binding protein EcfA2
MIELNGLTKRYGPTLAVDDLSFVVQPGKVTGFLGPNGAGKSTSMRMVLGLDRPTAGQALVDGRRYQELRGPLRVVGALLDAGAVHPRRSARPPGGHRPRPAPPWARSGSSPWPPWRSPANSPPAASAPPWRPRRRGGRC